jgi:hypothetical protein
VEKLFSLPISEGFGKVLKQFTQVWFAKSFRARTVNEFEVFIAQRSQLPFTEEVSFPRQTLEAVKQYVIVPVRDKHIPHPFS